MFMGFTPLCTVSGATLNISCQRFFVPKLYNLYGYPPSVFNTSVENRSQNPEERQPHYCNYWLFSTLHNRRCDQSSWISSSPSAEAGNL